MAKPPTGLHRSVYGCQACGWHMQIDVVIEIVGESDTHWHCTSTVAHASRVAMAAAKVSHHGPMKWHPLAEDDLDMNLVALGVLDPDDNN